MLLYLLPVWFLGACDILSYFHSLIIVSISYIGQALCSKSSSIVQNAIEISVVKLIVTTLTHSLTAARNRLWVVAPSMLTGHQQEPMRQQQ